MEIVEYIVLAVVVILALLFIIRMIRRVAKGDNSCVFCSSDNKKEKPSSCCDTSKEDKSDFDKNQNKDY